jgi:transmembrane sensor
MANNGFESERVERFFRDEYSDTDESYINNIFCDSERERDLKCLLSKHFNDFLPDDALDCKNLDHILHRIHFEINIKKSKQRNRPFNHIIKWTARVAVVLLLPIVMFIGIHNHNETSLKKETWVEIKAPAWTRAQFSLPDGTIGWLNSNSSIKYNGNFNADRQVTLTGEAFFDVYKDEARPFIVNTNEINVKVLGTRFNIASYDNEKTVEVVLEEGKLEFDDKEMNKSYTMKPNDLVVYDKSLKDFSTEVVHPQKYSSWTEGKLVFRNDPLDVIARRMERWYDIDIEIDSSSIEAIRWRATFVDEDLEEVLMYMKRSLLVDYKIEGGDLDSDKSYIKKKVIITLGGK